MVPNHITYGPSGSMCKVTNNGRGTGLPRLWFVPFKPWPVTMIWQVQIMVRMARCVRCQIMVRGLASLERNLFSYINSLRPWLFGENQVRRLLICLKTLRLETTVCLRYMFTMVEKCVYRHPCDSSVTYPNHPIWEGKLSFPRSISSGRRWGHRKSVPFAHLLKDCNHHRIFEAQLRLERT